MIPGQAALEARFEALLSAQPADDAAHDLGHLRRVWRSCQTIAAREDGPNGIVLIAAAYLHDLINLPKNSPERAGASARSADAAVDLLRAEGFPEPMLPAIHHAIVAHSYSAGIPPDSLEARILRDADRLDAMGAVGVARCFYIAGRMGTALFDPDDPFAEDREADDTVFALDHFEKKLLRLPEDMLTAGGKALAETRLATMTQYLDALRDEL